jgi:hypothetical protein
MPLENPPGKMHCFFNATVQLLRVLPEASVFFQRAYVTYRATSLLDSDRLGWSRDLGRLLTNEGTSREGSVAGIRAASYFPDELRRGQQDAIELLNLIIDLKNDKASNAETLADLLFSYEWKARRVCSVCDQVSVAQLIDALFNYSLTIGGRPRRSTRKYSQTSPREYGQRFLRVVGEPIPGCGTPFTGR